MKWMNKLERKFGRYAISNLMFYIIVLYAVGFVLSIINPQFYGEFLSLNAQAILRGQVWRIVTFIIQPPSTNIFFVIFVLYLYYMIGRQLEAAWGAFRFNLYFFSGVLLHVLAAILLYVITGQNLQLGTAYLNLSLFFAFAVLYPNMEFMLFMVVPVKVKWLAWLDAAIFLFTILQAVLPGYGGGVFGMYYKANALAAIVSILNFLIFFFMSRQMQAYSPKQLKRKNDFKKKVAQARRPERTFENGARHKCAVCGRTELDDPSLEFRYCSKCNGNHEYCQEHLFTHTHIK